MIDIEILARQMRIKRYEPSVFGSEMDTREVGGYIKFRDCQRLMDKIIRLERTRLLGLESEVEK